MFTILACSAAHTVIPDVQQTNVDLPDKPLRLDAIMTSPPELVERGRASERSKGFDLMAFEHSPLWSTRVSTQSHHFPRR